MDIREMGIEEARAKLGDLVRDAQQHGISTAVTRNGKRAARIVPDAEAGRDWHGDVFRAYHDLNGVSEVRILGWTGRHVITAHDEHWMRIEVPKRHEGDIWTFQQQRGGVLRCHSDLIGSPSLLTPTDMTMTVFLPADLAGVVKVRFITPETTPEEH